MNEYITDLKQEQSKYMNFTAYNKALVLGAAAICIGLATKEAISSIMNEVILPFLKYISKTSLIYVFYLFLLQKSIHNKIINAMILGLGKIIWIFLVWLLILYTTYIVFQYVIKFDMITDKLDFVSYISHKLHS